MKGSKPNEIDSPNSPPDSIVTTFDGIRGLAIQRVSHISEGRVLVADCTPPDRENNRILSVELTIPRTKILATFGNTHGKVVRPNGIAFDRTGNIFVADTGNDRIQKLTSDFMFIKQWFIRGPEGIAVDSNANVYVSSSNKITKFDNNGIFIKEWGRQGTGNGEFNGPYGIASQSNDDIVVVDQGNARIQKFKSDSQFIKGWGQPGEGRGEFGLEGVSGPKGVAVDSNDNIYVVDYENDRVQKFDRDGNWIQIWGRSSTTGINPFVRAWGIAFNRSNGEVLVSNVVRNISSGPIGEVSKIIRCKTDGEVIGDLNFGEIIEEPGDGGGEQPVAVPDVMGMLKLEAEREIRNAGLVPASSGPVAGEVVRQSPDPGTSVPKNSIVRIRLHIENPDL